MLWHSLHVVQLCPSVVSFSCVLQSIVLCIRLLLRSTVLCSCTPLQRCFGCLVSPCTILLDAQAVLLRQGLPDVTEVEVNGEGQWRPNGTNMPWRSIVTDTGPLTMSEVKIKPDPEQAPDSEPLLLLITGVHTS